MEIEAIKQTIKEYVEDTEKLSNSQIYLVLDSLAIEYKELWEEEESGDLEQTEEGTDLEEEADEGLETADEDLEEDTATEDAFDIEPPEPPPIPPPPLPKKKGGINVRPKKINISGKKKRDR